MNRKVIFALLLLMLATLTFSAAASADWVENADGTVSYTTASGKTLKNKRAKIGKYYYYFDREGVMARNTWVGKRYYNGKGRQVFSSFMDSRYIGKNGKYVTGLKKIDGSYFYFNKKTGYMVKSVTKTISGKTYVFDQNGVGTLGTKLQAESKTAVKSSNPVRNMTDEQLLATIIYHEAGNQPYSGQLAVGLVVTNRVRSSLFPNTIEEVLFQAGQFVTDTDSIFVAVANGNLTLPASCTKAAAEVMNMYKANTYKITNVEGKKVSMKGYYFFMTPVSFQRLGIKSASLTLWGHVFFKSWER